MYLLESAAQPLKVVIVDDSRLTHMALDTLFSRHNRFAVSGAATSVGECRNLIRGVRPHLLLCEADIAGENGLELCSWIRIVSPTTTPVILTWINDGSLAAAALKAGAAAFLLKNSPPDDLIFYLGSALAGQPIIDERVTMTLQRSADLDLQARFGLSSRERDVMEEVLQGLDNRSIACRLNISTDTVKSHVKAILRKTGARDRAHAIAVALGRCPSEIPTPRRPF